MPNHHAMDDRTDDSDNHPEQHKDATPEPVDSATPRGEPASAHAWLEVGDTVYGDLGRRREQHLYAAGASSVVVPAGSTADPGSDPDPGSGICGHDGD